MDIREKVRSIREHWLDSHIRDFKLITSGSTGKPKEITFTKPQLKKSAQLTIKTFNLNSQDNLLLCLNPEFIAGFMMIIRAQVLEANLMVSEPDSLVSFIEKQEKPIDFIAMVPLQLQKCLHSPIALNKIKKAKAIIIGGGTVNKELEQKAINAGLNCYHTYAMTETITHVAIRKFDQALFDLLPGFTVKIDDRGCAVIKTPYDNKPVKTNDILEIHGSRFQFIGRADHVINTGGIKINPEQVEPVISNILEKELDVQNNFYLSSEKNSELGEALVLVMEGETKVEKSIILNTLKQNLPRYHAPKRIITIEKIKKTPTGKVIRKNI